MLTNATLLRIDKYVGHHADSGLPIYADAPLSINVECNLSVDGNVFNRRLERLQIAQTCVGRCYVSVDDLGGDQDILGRLDRVLIKPARGEERFYICDIIAAHVSGGSMDHLEIELRDP